jgi:pimeloyl-ACP methyl ester carboxylesterase
VNGYEANARAAVRAALAELQSGPGPRPSGKLAYAGHSLGSLLALRLAATAAADGLPSPVALVLHEPAGVAVRFVKFPLAPADLATIDPRARLLVIQAETSVGDRNSFAQGAFEATVSIPHERKNLLVVRSDAHGKPPLVSDHLGVQAGNGRPLDAIDWWGYVRPTEAALAEALGDPAPDSAYCNEAGPRCDWVRDSGTWSDGTPVRRTQNAADVGL